MHKIYEIAKEIIIILNEVLHAVCIIPIGKYLYKYSNKKKGDTDETKIKPKILFLSTQS